jgi:IMP dehydrogenase
MIEIIEKGLSLDDVLLRPRFSSIESRFNGSIDLSTEILPGIKVKVPMISANMDTVTGFRLAEKMRQLGGLGIVHRFLELSEHFSELQSISSPRVVCIGVSEKDIERLKFLQESVGQEGFSLEGVLIDIAHGHSVAMLKQIEEVKKISGLPIMAGNVATYDGCLDLLRAGADSVKVGVGGGSVCSTRIQTGNGVPQLTAIMECHRAMASFSKATLIADGGIKNSGDIVKCLAAGADAVMIGNLFAATEESPGNIISRGNSLVKAYRGMASFSAQKAWKGAVTSIEGENIELPYKGALEPIFQRLVAGILSGFSYQNAHSIRELQKNAVFIKQTSAGYRESLPHASLDNK